MFLVLSSSLLLLLMTLRSLFWISSLSLFISRITIVPILLHLLLYYFQNHSYLYFVNTSVISSIITVSLKCDNVYLAKKKGWSYNSKHVCQHWPSVRSSWLSICLGDMRNKKGTLLSPKDLPAVVRKVANFLGKAVTEEEVEKLADHCSFGSMSMNKAVNNEDIIAPSSERTKNIKFMRKGQVSHVPVDLFEFLCVSMHIDRLTFLGAYKVIRHR